MLPTILSDLSGGSKTLLLGALTVVLSAAPCQVQAQNRLLVADRTVPVSSDGNEISVFVDNDRDVYGLSVSLTFDSTKIQIADVQLGAEVAALEPEWHAGTVDNSAGRLSHGVVFDVSGPALDKHLAPGSTQEILRLIVDVLVTSETATELDLVDEQGPPARLNELADGNGDPIPLSLVDGTLTIVDLGPQIDSYVGNSGEPGTVFLIVGQNFDQPGLRVRVGSSPAEASLLTDGQTISVTAPECAPGPLEVEVCTDFGCDSDPQGFTCVSPPGPVIEGYLGNSGLPGTEFTVVGRHFDGPGLVVRVGGGVAAFALIDDARIQVTAPECTPGPLAVEVCTDFGCDSDPQGFSCESPPGPVIEGYLGNSGLPGTEFTVLGRHFDEPGLVVRVGAGVVAFTLIDDTRIRVVAPECAPSALEVAVCTDFGCDIDPQGFTCQGPSAPVIEGYVDNSGEPGTEFLILGQNFDESGLTVRLGGMEAEALLVDPQTIRVIAPECTPGALEVEVCTDIGCASDPEGFLCEGRPVPLIEGFLGNSGPPGTEFTILGQNFDGPGLVVRLGGVGTAAVLVDPQTIRVTAPECTPGALEVEVCTDVGCTSEPEGFLCEGRPVPVIEGFLGNSGPPGTEFTILGQNFDQPGLTVRLGGVETEAALVDPQTIRITAPECAPGALEVEVCTDVGCASEPEGFSCEAFPVPVIEGYPLGNTGAAGFVFLISGRNFGEPGLEVTICDVEVETTLIGDEASIQVVVPGCQQSGCVGVEVCTDFGCDADDQGFCYPEPVEFLRGDASADGVVDITDPVVIFGHLFLGEPPGNSCEDSLDGNDDGNVDIADGIWILNFLFQGGPIVRPPYPHPGPDPTPEDGLDC